LSQKSYELLKAPIQAAENLAKLAPLKAGGEGAKQFCAQIGPVLAKFPFNPDSSNDASTEEVAAIFASGGSFSQFVTSAPIKTLVMQQGSQIVKASGSAENVNPGFLNFLNSAQKISSTLFTTGNQPSLDFTLTEVKSPGSPDAIINIDNQQITTAGQKLTFHWISTPGSHYSLSTPGNSSTPPPSPWSVFHFGLLATHIPPDRLKFNLNLNNLTNGSVMFDVTGPGAVLLNRDFMKDFRCVSQVAH
jgi:type VI secretion system protein ImpL